MLLQRFPLESCAGSHPAPAVSCLQHPLPAGPAAHPAEGWAAGIPIPTLPHVPLPALRGTKAQQLPAGLTLGGLTCSWHPAGSSRWNGKRTPCCNSPPVSAVHPRNKLIAAVKPPPMGSRREASKAGVSASWSVAKSLARGQLASRVLLSEEGLAADHLPGISSCLSYKKTQMSHPKLVFPWWPSRNVVTRNILHSPTE